MNVRVILCHRTESDSKTGFICSSTSDGAITSITSLENNISINFSSVAKDLRATLWDIFVGSSKSFKDHQGQVTRCNRVPVLTIQRTDSDSSNKGPRP